MRALPLLLLAFSLSACATTGDRASLDPRDPHEGFNRSMFAFNDAVDKAAIKPATTVYRTVTPVPARRGLSNVFANLMEPLNFINNLLQGKPDRAMDSLGRFVVNTTIGVGGLADHATDLGIQPAREDFGQTFAVWGAKESPYLVLPLLGPSTIRDGAGTALQFVADPAQIGLSEAGVGGTERTVLTGLRLVDARSRLMDAGVDAVLETSADPYATARDAFFQRRQAQLRDEDDGPVAVTEEDQDALLREALEADTVEPKPEPKD